MEKNIMAFKCTECSQGVPSLAPVLVVSGYATPKDMKCPICDTFYNGDTGETTKASDEEAEKRTSRIRQGLLVDPQYYTPDRWW